MTTVKQRPKKAMPVSPGRPKGSPNKTTALLKDAILMSAEQAGGDGGLVAYLKVQALDNPGPFLSLLGKVLPMQITGANGGALETKSEVIVRIIDAAHPPKEARDRGLLE